MSFATAPSTAVKDSHTATTPDSESDANYQTDTETDSALDESISEEARITTFSSMKVIAECDDVVRVARFPEPPVVEREAPTEVDWAAATPPPEQWPSDLNDLFRGNPAGAATWQEVETAMLRLVTYHAVSDSVVSLTLMARPT